jgi:hypothetical protein
MSAEDADALGGLIQRGQGFVYGGGGVGVIHAQELEMDSGGGEERAGLVVEGSGGGLELEAGGVKVAG